MIPVSFWFYKALTNDLLYPHIHCRMTVGLIGNNEFKAVEQWLHSFMVSVETLGLQEVYKRRSNRLDC
jgi:hypothetical protein